MKRHVHDGDDVDKCNARAPCFRPEVIPDPFDVGGLNDAMFWLVERGPVGESAQTVLSAVGMLLMRTRDLTVVLQKLWQSFEDFHDHEPKDLTAEQIVDEIARRLEQWSDTDEAKAACDDAAAIMQALKFTLRTTNPTGETQ